MALKSVGSGVGGGGTVTSVGLTSTDLTVSGSPVTGSGNITANLATQGGVTPGSFTNANITVNSKGVVTAAANGSAGGSGTVTSVGLTSSTLTVTGSPITTSGTLDAEIANNSVTNALLAQAAANTIKGNNTGSSANVADLTAAQVVAMLAAATTQPLIQYQWGIPVMIPSSGSFGNNGALTGLTALPTTFAKCYMYFPANAIASGVAAGFYYAVMSSTTAATVYNNTLSSGIPTVPGTPTAFATTGPGAYTQSTSAQTALTLSIPGGSMGANGGSLHFKVRALGANNADTRSITVSYGGTQIANANSTTIQWYGYERTLQNVGSQSVQAVFGNAIGNTATDGVFNAGAPSFSAVNSANVQNLTFVLTIGTATDYLVLLGGEVDTTFAQ